VFGFADEINCSESSSPMIHDFFDANTVGSSAQALRGEDIPVASLLSHILTFCSFSESREVFVFNKLSITKGHA
jgi:hypothetical protein